MAAGVAASVVTGATVREATSPGTEDAQLTLLCTGDVLGRLAPCGCARANQPVGIAKRTTLVRRLREEAGASLVLDAGNLATTPVVADVVLDALAAAGYDGLGLGVYDLPWLDQTLGLARKHGLPVLHCGVTGSEHALNAPGASGGAIYLKLGLQRIAVTAALPAPGVRHEDVIASLVRDIRSIRSDADAVVMLSHLGELLDEAVATAGAEERLVDVILARRSRDEATLVTQVGTTALAIVPSEADAVSVITLKPENGRLAVSARTVLVSRDTAGDPEVHKIVEAYYAEQQQRLVTRSRPTGESAPARAAFTPAQECRRCHPGEYDRWRDGPHAGALVTLQQRERAVPECAICHSETYRRTKQLPADESRGDGVQCASCHGDGIVHAVTRDRRYVERGSLSSTCVVCHNEDHSPEFLFEAYLARIRH